MVGRTLATIAEISFIIQLSLFLKEISKNTGNRFGLVISKTILPLIIIAEICSWYAVITTSYLGNIIEESIWGFCGFLLTLAAISIWVKLNPKLKKLLTKFIIFGMCYIGFMCFIDVPMYMDRYKADSEIVSKFFSSQGKFLELFE